MDLEGQPLNIIQQFSVTDLGTLSHNSLLILGDTT